MRRLLHFHLIYLVLLFTIISCDSGDIVEKQFNVGSTGKTLKLSGSIQGVDDWNGTDYHLALAGFSSDSKFAIMQRTISTNSNELDIVVSNISDEVSTMELSITNALRKRIITLSSLKMEDYEDNTSTDTIYMDLGTLDVSMFGALQSGLFNQACLQCHGGNGRKAGNLDLTEGNAHHNLVDITSTQKEGATRVISGDAENSLLWQILNEGGENLLHYNHTEVLSSQFKDNLDEVKGLLSHWITSLQTD